MGNRILTDESLLFSSLFEDSWPTVDSRLSGGRALDNISAKFVPESTLAARSRASVISSVKQADITEVHQLEVSSFKKLKLTLFMVEEANIPLTHQLYDMLHKVHPWATSPAPLMPRLIQIHGNIALF
jgi:hypothetical protein